jgi:Zn-dependent peptidase ImmA (M78 family)/transcriptional regulator with XRE-family HTH domain
MPTSKTIAWNLRRLRNAKDTSQEELAEKAAISRSAYRKIESGQSEPRVGTLQGIAAALGVRVQDLVSPVRERKAVRFRSLKRLRSREQILAETGRWLDDFSDLEKLLGEKPRRALEGLSFRGKPSLDLAVRAAGKTRQSFGIDPDEPIRDICGLLEARGVKVGRVSIASPDFFGLSIGSADGGPAVVVNTWDRISVERWIFTAAHELGHLILHLSDYDVRKTEESKEHERQANAFAAEFLMPDSAFRKEWDETYGLAFVDRVFKVKRIFRVSYRTVLYRLAASGAVDENVWVRFQRDYQRRFHRPLLRDDEPNALARDAFLASFPEHMGSGEPERLSGVDFPGDRLSRLVRTAVERKVISLGRGAEIFGCSLQEMRELSASWVG